MLPLAPALLSITTGWFQRLRISSPTIRARTSGPLPGVKGTMMKIGRSDRRCADAGPATSAATAQIARSAVRRTDFMCTLPDLVGVGARTDCSTPAGGARLLLRDGFPLSDLRDFLCSGPCTAPDLFGHLDDHPQLRPLL